MNKKVRIWLVALGLALFIAAIITGMVLQQQAKSEMQYEAMAKLERTFDTKIYLAGSPLDGDNLSVLFANAQSLTVLDDTPMPGMDVTLGEAMRWSLGVDLYEFPSSGETRRYHFPSPVAFLVQNGEDVPIFCQVEGIDTASVYMQAKTLVFCKRTLPFMSDGQWRCSYDLYVFTLDGKYKEHVTPSCYLQTSPLSFEGGIAEVLSNWKFSFSPEYVNPLENEYQWARRLMITDIQNIIDTAVATTSNEVITMVQENQWTGVALEYCDDEGHPIPPPDPSAPENTNTDKGRLTLLFCNDTHQAWETQPCENAPLCFMLIRATAYNPFSGSYGDGNSKYGGQTLYTYIYERKLYDVERCVYYQYPDWQYKGMTPTTTAPVYDVHHRLVYTSGFLNSID